MRRGKEMTSRSEAVEEEREKIPKRGGRKGGADRGAN